MSKTAAHIYFITLSKYFPYLFILHSPCESGKVSKEILFFLPFIWLSQPWKPHYRSSVGREISHKLNIQLLSREDLRAFFLFILMNVSDTKMFTIHQFLPAAGQRIKSLHSWDRNVFPSHLHRDPSPSSFVNSLTGFFSRKSALVSSSLQHIQIKETLQCT